MVLLTACFFGLAHYYGQPSGPMGVVLAGIAGWFWGKSMIETPGWAWAFVIHLVQDIVIFAFLAMTPTAERVILLQARKGFEWRSSPIVVGGP